MKRSPENLPKSLLRSIAWWIGMGILMVVAVFSGVACISLLNDSYDDDMVAVRECNVLEATRHGEPLRGAEFAHAPAETAEVLCVEGNQCGEEHKIEDVAKENKSLRNADSAGKVCLMIGCFIVLLLCMMSLIWLLRRRGMRILWGLCLSAAMGNALSLCGSLFVIGIAFLDIAPFFDLNLFSLSMFFGIMAVLCIGVSVCFALAHAAWCLVLYIRAPKTHFNSHE